MKRLYAAHGWNAYWQDQLRRAAGRDLPSARAHVRLGNLDEAIRRLERLYDTRHPWLAFTNQPEWDPLRGDARFQALRARTGFTDTLDAELARARSEATARAENQ